MKLVCVLYVCTMFAGCSSFEGIGEDLGSGLVKGATDSLDTPQRIEKLNRVVDSLLAALGSATRREIPLLLDTLQLQRRIDELSLALTKNVVEMRNDLLGARTQQPLLGLRDSLLGGRTVSSVQTLLDSALATILSANTVVRAAALRDELLGPSTNSAVRSIVDSAMVSLVSRYKQDLSPALTGDVGIITKYAQEILITGGGIALAIIGYVWWQKRKYQKTVGMLAVQINDIPDQSVYDSLTRNIQRSAQGAGLEPLLRKTLSSQGLLGVESWRPPRKPSPLAQAS